jgi:hypothetical protein
MTLQEADVVCKKRGLNVCDAWRSTYSGVLYVWAVDNRRTKLRFLRAEHVDDLNISIDDSYAEDYETRTQYMKRR